MILIPQFQNLVETSGTLSIVHTDGFGNLKENRFYSNIVTAIGKKWLAGRMKDTVSGTAPQLHTIPGQMTHMGLAGNGSPGAAVTKITLAENPPTVVYEALSTTAQGSVTVGELATRQNLTYAGGTFAAYGTTGVNNLIPTVATITYASSFGTGVCTGAIIQAGIFNAGTAGVMLCTTSFDVVNKQAADTIAITWTINIA